MGRRTRVWIGITMFAIIAFNYAIIGYPLFKRSSSIKEQTRILLLKQAKSQNPFKGSEDEYIMEIFRREKASIDNRFLILNGVAISLAIAVASWTVFGMIVSRKR